MDAENFIPWSQIEPLVRPGMTFADLADAVCVRAGLPRERYHLRTRYHFTDEPLTEVLRDGVWLISVAEAESLPARNAWDEVIA